MKAKARFFADIDGVSYELFPTSSLTIRKDRVGDTFMYKTTVGNLRLVGADYALFKGLSEMATCSKVQIQCTNEQILSTHNGDFSSEFSSDFDIDYNITEGGILFQGEVDLSNISFDDNACYCDISIQIVDNVSTFELKSELEFNFFSKPRFTVQPFFGEYEETLEVVIDENPDLYVVLPADPENWCGYVLVEVIPSVSPLFEHRTTWYRIKAEGTTSSPPSVSGDWIQIGTTSFWRTCGGKDILIQPECCTLENVLDSSGLQIASHFLNVNKGAVSPLDASVSTNKYYTYAQKYLSKLAVIQKSNAKRPTASLKASSNVYNMKLSQLLNDLKVMFNVRWFFEGNILRIEHISFFKSIAIADGFSSLGLKSGDTENARKAEIYRWADRDGYGQDFSSYNIFYDCSSSNKIEEYSLSYFTNDLLFIQDLNNAQYVSDAGFVMIATDEIAGVNHIINGNLPMSWEHLHSELHTAGKPYPVAQINNSESDIDFVEVLFTEDFKGCVQQTDIPFFNGYVSIVNGLDVYVSQSIEINYGTGVVNSKKRKLK